MTERFKPIKKTKENPEKNEKTGTKIYKRAEIDRTKPSCTTLYMVFKQYIL